MSDHGPITAFVERTPPFSGFVHVERTSLAKALALRSWSAGSVVLERGSAGHAFVYPVVSGRLQASDTLDTRLAANDR